MLTHTHTQADSSTLKLHSDTTAKNKTTYSLSVSLHRIR